MTLATLFRRRLSNVEADETFYGGKPRAAEQRAAKRAARYPRQSGALNRKPKAAVFDSVSRKWLQGYLNEFVWRYNQRRSMDGRAMFDPLALRTVSTALPWS